MKNILRFSAYSLLISVIIFGFACNKKECSQLPDLTANLIDMNKDTAYYFSFYEPLILPFKVINQRYDCDNFLAASESKLAIAVRYRYSIGDTWRRVLFSNNETNVEDSLVMLPVKALQNNEGTVVKFMLNFSTPGIYMFTYAVDYLDEVKEAREDNNGSLFSDKKNNEGGRTLELNDFTITVKAPNDSLPSSIPFPVSHPIIIYQSNSY